MNIYDQSILKIQKVSRAEKLDQFIKHLKPTEQDKVLEVGIADYEYSAVDNFLIKNYPYPNNLTALSLGQTSIFSEKYPHVRLVNYDGGVFPLKTNEFDIVHSNAVIEHVGQLDAQILFLSEVVRVAKRGMITTPNRNFPIEIHTRIPLIHFLGKNIFDKFANAIGKGWATGDYMYLLSFNDLDKLAQKAGLKNYFILKNSFLGFTMTLTLIWEK